MGLSIVLPILKNEAKSTNDITNYRHISIMPVKSKIFEKCIANIIEPYFKFSDSQYGFVNNGGCGKALFIFRHVVNYFRDLGSNVYCCSLEITKAFVVINHQALLNAMKDIEMTGCIIVKIFVNWWCKLQNLVM